jgi:hypothetical protein
MVKKSVGVKIAEGVSEYNNINDTVWIDACCTLADEIDIKLEDAKKEGAIEQKEKDKIDFIRLEVMPKSKKKQYRVFFKDGTEQVFELEGVKQNE